MNDTRWGVLALVVMIGLMVGCGSSAAPIESNFVVTSLDARALGYNTRWAANMGVAPGQTINHAVTLGDLVVLVETPQNLVTAIDAGTGHIRWRRQWLSEAEILFEPSRSDNLIVINSSNVLYHLDARTGRSVSQFRLADQVSDGPVVTEGLAIFGSVNGRLFAHEVETGLVRWQELMSTSIVVRPIIVDGHIFVADGAGVYSLIDALTGDRLWTGKAFSRVSARPVTSPTTQFIYVPSEDQNLYAIDRTTGRDQWIYRTTAPLRNHPALLGNTLFMTRREGLTAIDAVNGKELWTRPEQFHTVDLNDQRLVAHNDYYLMVLDATNGRTLREVPFIEPVQTVITGPQDSLVVIAPNGRIVRLDPRR